MALAHILFQSGIFVPGNKACMSPVDGIYTHFSCEEKPDTDAGKLGEESLRIKSIFDNATRYSLILLNESFSSTSPMESLYISREILYALKILETRAIFATHLHELALNLDLINNAISGDSTVASLISVIADQSNDVNKQENFNKRSFKIMPGAPQGTSFAKDILSKYGVSFEKLIITMQKRNVVDSEININELSESILQGR